MEGTAGEQIDLKLSHIAVGGAHKRARSSESEGDEESSWEPSSSEGEGCSDGSNTEMNDSANHSSPPFAASQAAAPSKEAPEEDSSDDELEVLLVIQPPTPKRPKNRNLPPLAHQTQQPSAESSSTATTVAVTPSTRILETQTSFSASHVSRGEKEPVEAQAAVAPMTANDQKPQYSYMSSAYVQNLAEICHAIWWDGRWRAGDNGSKLFSWERGDDLSAVLAISRLYHDERPEVGKRKGRNDACLLCRESNRDKCTEQKEVRESDQIISSRKEGSNAPNREIKEATASGSAAHNMARSTTDQDEDYDRALHLYCRLFYRKGPWFRLDDLYSRYYLPKNETPHTESTAASSSADNHGEDSNNVGGPNDESDQAKSATNGRTAFFLPKHLSGRSKSPSVESMQVDGKPMHEKLDALSKLCQDVFRLLSMGLIRSFHDEEECGKTVGAVFDEGTGVLLTAEERRRILSKLGGGAKKQTQQHNGGTTFSKAGSSDESGRRLRRGGSRENQVWKQMRRQQSIVGQIQGNTQSKVLLPVCKHVNEMLLEKLATKIVLSSCPGSSLAASVLREQVSEVKNTICCILRDITANSDVATVADLTMCIRLREAPLRTLRRVTRLYLCASHGPGNMRGDGTNGWMSIREPSEVGPSHKDLPMLNYIQPPGSQTWHSIAYPALLHRFGISTCAFIQAFQSISADKNEHHTGMPKQMEGLHEVDRIGRVFSRVGDFHTWELCAEVRANVDYLIELNDLIHYDNRKKLEAGARNHDSSILSAGVLLVGSSKSSEDSSPPFETVPLDFLGILTARGREVILKQMLSFGDERGRHEPTVSDEVMSQVQNDVEVAILSLFETDNAQSTASTASGISTHGSHIAQETETRPQSPAHSSTTGSIGRLENDCEVLIAVMSIIATHVLSARHKLVSPAEVSLMATRPWLRHMWWDGNLAYVLWDCVPILEKRGHYELATNALEVLLFGCSRGLKEVSFHSLPNLPTAPLASIIISRRARGKAYERLVIDYTHILRLRGKNIAALAQSDSKTERKSTKCHGKRKKARKNFTEQQPSTQQSVARLCEAALKSVASSGSIPFSAARSLARRVKRPLVEVLSVTKSMEATELRLRLDVEEDENTGKQSNPKKYAGKGYRDWTPITDNAMANAIEGETTEVGGRCSFVGFEDDGMENIAPTSLNVEELAMEFYASGRLPNGDQANVSGPRGGWVGWHDEGGHVRALFRILCARVLLGVDGGCDKHNGGAVEDMENLTIYLTPYQSAPFDLHVGHALTCEGGQSGEAQEPGAESKFVRGFYQRRRDTINRFLSKLETLDPQEISDLVFDSVVERLRVLGLQGSRDTVLQRDLQQIRTLSMLAAGFGGQMLSAMFRCLCVDYRHYSGGLPDLLLVRALYEQIPHDEGTAPPKDLVDLGDWIGEGFSAESKESEEMSRRASLLVDRDEEFLGCSKLGDSGGQSSGRWRGGGQRASRRKVDDEHSNLYSIERLPEKLCLAHNEQQVQVECMFVEVKSSNDRLDPRQEDWLNVLDRVGNARVCKFSDGKKKSGRSVRKQP